MLGISPGEFKYTTSTFSSLPTLLEHSFNSTSSDKKRAAQTTQEQNKQRKHPCGENYHYSLYFLPPITISDVLVKDERK